MTDAQHRDEGRRQAYLAALGIPLWSARVELPGALPAAPLAFVPFVAEAQDRLEVFAPGQPSAPGPAQAGAGNPAAATRAPAGAASVVASPQTLPPGEAAAGAPARDLAAPTPGRAAAPVADAPRPPARDDRFPRLSCRAWTLAPGISAVIALDDAPDLSAAEYRLLDNIARALDASEMPAAVGELLRWPLNRNPALDHGPEALRTWLGHALRLPPGRCVVFGEALAAHVAGALPGAAVTVAPALGQLLADPGAKRRLWQALNG